MGQSLPTPDCEPSVCPLCHGFCRNPTALRCKHIFCYCCIQELWSGSPTGPYYCPECKEEYKTLPVGFKRDTTASPWRHEINSAGWTLGKRASISQSKRLLGKRPASSPVPGGHLHDNKRQATGSSSSSHSSGQSGDRKRPATSSSSSSANQNTSSDVELSSEEEVPAISNRSGPIGTSTSPTRAANNLSPGRTNLSPSLARQTSRETFLPCHYCPSQGSLPAVKTCLVCGASMCSDHLRPHLESPVFQSHTLVPPVEDTSPWRCPEHQEMNRIYCRQCSVCVCTVCTVIGSHRDHACVSIREAERELRVRNGGEESRAVGGLEEQLTQLQETLSSLQRGLHTLEGLADTRGAARVQEQSFIMVLPQSSYFLVSESCSVEELEVPQEVDRARLRCLQQWTERRLVSVVISLPDRDPFRLLCKGHPPPRLDPDTAHPKLLISEENRKVSYSEVQQAYPEQGARRAYWEVEVEEDEGKWKVGVCEGQIGRKGQKDTCRIGFNPYSWCLLSEKGKIEALHDKVDGLGRVGVLLDFEEGSLSFYKVAQGGALSLLHCFKQRFSEPLYPALAVSKTQLNIPDLFQAESVKSE
uniref:Uncharacterized protein n=1 Tax=Oncorhynchus tshawytscha TaxID=74940 RepID=A0AAZ3Q6E1_ONCTS